MTWRHTGRVGIKHENLKLCQLLNDLFQGKNLQYTLDRKLVGLHNLVSAIMRRKILPHVGIKPLSFNATASHHTNSQNAE
jgi:hypothetical protein